MLMSKLATFYGVLLIAATDAFPGMIPNSARQNAPISDSQPIRLSSVSGGATSSLVADTLSPSLPTDLSRTTAPVPSLSAPTTTNQPDIVATNPSVSTSNTPTVAHDATETIQTQVTATESLARVA